jgi:predicted ATPase
VSSSVATAAPGSWGAPPPLGTAAGNVATGAGAATLVEFVAVEATVSAAGGAAASEEALLVMVRPEVAAVAVLATEV